MQLYLINSVDGFFVKSMFPSKFIEQGLIPQLVKDWADESVEHTNLITGNLPMAMALATGELGYAWATNEAYLNMLARCYHEYRALGYSSNRSFYEAITLTDQAYEYYQRNPLPFAQLTVPLIIAAVLVVSVMGILLIFNPTETKLFTRTWRGGRYCMRIDQMIWWADMIQKGPQGTTYYVNCGEVGYQIDTESRTQDGQSPHPDYWAFVPAELPGQRVKFHFEQELWRKASANYVGLLRYITGGLYKMKNEVVDIRTREVEAGWRKDGENWCEEPESTRILH